MGRLVILYPMTSGDRAAVVGQLTLLPVPREKLLTKQDTLYQHRLFVPLHQPLKEGVLLCQGYL